MKYGWQNKYKNAKGLGHPTIRKFIRESIKQKKLREIELSEKEEQFLKNQKYIMKQDRLKRKPHKPNNTEYQSVFNGTYTRPGYKKTRMN